MTIELGYLGRALRLSPGAFGELFHDACTVSKLVTETEWFTHVDPMTGEESTYPKRVRRTDKVPLYWYADSRGKTYFCTYSGYGPRILASLRDRGMEVEVVNLVRDGLEPPDLSAVRHVVWRTRQKEVFAKLLAYPRGIILCPTAFGKTFICCQLARVYPNASIVYTVPQIDVARKAYKELQINLPYNDVGFIGGGRNKVRRVNVVSSMSLHNAPKDANLILADECHSLLTETYIKKFNKFTRARLFGLTASLGRSDKADAFGEALFGPVIADVTYQEAEAGGNVVPITVRMVTVPQGPDVSGISNDVKVNRVGIWLNDSRNRTIARAVRGVEEELGADAQILIMVATAEHAYALGQLLGDYAIVTGETPESRYSNMIRRGIMLPTQERCTKAMREKYLEDFEGNKLKRAIATTIWKQGVDFRDLACLVRADGQASQINAIQIPGRLSRLGRETDKERGILIDFYDEFSRNLKARSEQRLSVYRKNGWRIVRV